MRLLILALGLLLALAPLAQASPDERPPQDPTGGPDGTPPPPSGGNDTADGRNDTADGRNDTREDGGERGPPGAFPGPGGLPADPSERFPSEACEHAPAERPGAIPSWVVLPSDRCGQGDGDAGSQDPPSDNA